MAAKPLTEEAIAMTEKKMDMTLDDIIKMSKNKTVKPRKQRISNRSKNSVNNSTQDKAMKLKRFMDTRSAMRQGALAQRRSNSQRNQFPLAAEAAKKAAAIPIRNKPFNAVRAVNTNRPRGGAFVHERAVTSGGGFRMQFQESVPYGGQQHKQHSSVSNKQKPQTLDSLFANMKEERMRVMSQQSNNNQGRRNNAGGGQRYPPWQRGRFGK
ncbi:OLC1v1030035C1 [Oldenlandia corymbosa var. corymbosa]|uniref:OLC1v1030035C1 n=1 Tax=Oldenlandia corymbosa var. corymbosa TaxID=529605 RepID=A0AAV1CIC9_OLDCO|nr:OLC1v1030035C1 [Oldenlandia corymbosa var. corymbosa]